MFVCLYRVKICPSSATKFFAWNLGYYNQVSKHLVIDQVSVRKPWSSTKFPSENLGKVFGCAENLVDDQGGAATGRPAAASRGWKSEGGSGQPWLMGIRRYWVAFSEEINHFLAASRGWSEGGGSGWRRRALVAIRSYLNSRLAAAGWHKELLDISWGRRLPYHPPLRLILIQPENGAVN